MKTETKLPNMARPSLWRLAMLFFGCANVAQPGSQQGDVTAASRCANHACSPPMGNLASGRTLHTQKLCCPNVSVVPSCPLGQTPCPERQPNPPTAMADDPFLHPSTFWASEGEQDEVRLDLEAPFILTHVVMVFRSPRPSVMVVERSRDFGRTWETLKMFAENCSATFGVRDDVGQRGAPCTSRYSSPAPCTGGEVIFRSLGQNVGTADPYSLESLSKLTLTNLRIRLLKPQRCPAASSRGHRNAPRLVNGPGFSTGVAPFAVYSLVARGTCLCHGHAEQCVPVKGGTDSGQSSNMVQGRCVCSHHTAGAHCESCAPLYNDQPWRAANGSSGEPNACGKCECHGHATSCHFSERVWRSTAGISGGVCDHCQHNTAGRRCQRCQPGFHRHPAHPVHSPHACTRCWCDPVGSAPSQAGEGRTFCHPRSGQCQCKPGVGGMSCGQCLPGFWGLGADGCKPCLLCDRKNCDPITGHCLDSKPHGEFYNVPIGGKIPDLTHFLPRDEDEDEVWSKKLAVSALHHTGKCICKERKVKSVFDLCRRKHTYMVKASVLSAHDKGSHAVVLVKVRKVLRSGVLPLSQGTHSLYPLSWTSRGCTCPVLYPGVDYLLSGPEETVSGRLLVTLQSLALPWTPSLSSLVSEALRHGCLSGSFEPKNLEPLETELKS